MKLNKPLLRRWVKWLRSGQYRQGNGELVDNEGTHFCCLGVLADIQGCEWRVTITDDLTPYQNAKAKKPMSVEINSDTHRLKIAEDGGYIHPKYSGGLNQEQIKYLAEMNDKGSSFREIANHIEKNILK